LGSPILEAVGVDVPVEGPLAFDEAEGAEAIDELFAAPTLVVVAAAAGDGSNTTGVCAVGSMNAPATPNVMQVGGTQQFTLSGTGDDEGVLTIAGPANWTATGIPGMISADMVKPGAVVVDVGINRVTDNNGKSRLVGDIQFEAIANVVEYITPVPGGIGPMTVAMLLQNTVSSYLQTTGN
jgi:hypothetical protein